MFIVNYWWLFLLIGVILILAAVTRQAMKFKRMSSDPMRFMQVGNHFPDAVESVFDGLVLTMLLGVSGSVSIIVGIVGLIKS
jgi:hypothetical protein